MPPKALALIMEWATIHKEELLENWQAIQDLKPLKKIQPLIS